MVCRTCTTDGRRRGFTITEALMASVILAVAVVGIAGPLGAAAEQSRALQENGVALMLARELLEEIAAKPLWDTGATSARPGPETAAGEMMRGQFDSVDDYHNYRDGSNELRDLHGQLAGLDRDVRFDRTVTVEFRTVPWGSAAATGDFALVSVSVTTPHRQTVKVSRLLSRFALPA